MLMPMMRIRKVLMAVRHRLVAVPVHMLAYRARTVRVHVHVLMVLIVYVLMAVLENFVRVFMTMRFGQMQPHANAHKYAGNQQLV